MSITMTNTQDNQLIKRKGSFWLRALEVSVHNWLFGPMARQHSMPEVYGGSNYLLHDQEVKKRKKERARVLLSPLRETKRLPMRPCFLKFT
jgi:hypothetical protein